MGKYKVIIYETLSKAVDIEAKDCPDAIQKVREKYNHEEIVLSTDDYLDTEFDCVKV